MQAMNNFNLCSVSPGQQLFLFGLGDHFYQCSRDRLGLNIGYPHLRHIPALKAITLALRKCLFFPANIVKSGLIE